VLGEAVRRAGSIETEKVRAALAALRIETPLGSYRVGANGQQLGNLPAVAQIQRGKVRIVWPEDLQAGALQPYLPWKDRQLIQ
jgi:hypothetical protein